MIWDLTGKEVYRPREDWSWKPKVKRYVSRKTICGDSQSLNGKEANRQNVSRDVYSFKKETITDRYKQL
jgi:hypothetical protein